MAELEKYRAAVQRLGRDLVDLRTQLRDKEEECGGLRRQLQRYDESTSLLLESADVDGITKAQLAERYGEGGSRAGWLGREGWDSFGGDTRVDMIIAMIIMNIMYILLCDLGTFLID